MQCLFVYCCSLFTTFCTQATQSFNRTNVIFSIRRHPFYNQNFYLCTIHKKNFNANEINKYVIEKEVFASYLMKLEKSPIF